MTPPSLPRIAVGADHAGVDLKDHLAAWLAERGHPVVDKGTCGHGSCHYPEFAFAVAQAVAGGEADLGVLVCGTGQGMAMAANRVPDIRAGVVMDTFSAAAIREHNDARVICMGARVIGPGLAEACLEAFLGASFLGGRHQLRVDLMRAAERGEG
ncbi:MAG: ribose 5-phosphate isomerase B [Pseudomonadota bacterium]